MIRSEISAATERRPRMMRTRRRCSGANSIAMTVPHNTAPKNGHRIQANAADAARTSSQNARSSTALGGALTGRGGEPSDFCRHVTETGVEARDRAIDGTELDEPEQADAERPEI